jgi:hypothetical protein
VLEAAPGGQRAARAGQRVRNRRRPWDELLYMSRLPFALRPKRAPCAVAATLLLASASLRAAAADSIELRRSDSERAPPSPVWLRLRGGYARGGEPRERVFGVLELGLALDVLVAGRANALAAGDPSGADREGSRGEAQEIAAPGDAGAAPPLPRASAPFRPAPLPHALELSAALARATLAAAGRVADAAASPAALDSMLARTHSSASLPEVRLAAGTSRDQSQRLAPTVTDPAKFTQDGGRDLWFEARLTWRLEHALFSHDEIAIERLKAQALENRRHLLRQVLEALMDWQRARQALRSELLSEEERQAAELRELDALLRLDAWTDGWFSRHLERTPAAEAHTRLAPALDGGACEPGTGGLQVAHAFGDPTGTRGPQAAR